MHFEMVFTSSPMESLSSHNGTITLPNSPVSGGIDLEVAIIPAQAVRANQGTAFPPNTDDLEPDGEILQSFLASLPRYWRFCSVFRSSAWNNNLYIRTPTLRSRAWISPDYYVRCESSSLNIRFTCSLTDTLSSLFMSTPDGGNTRSSRIFEDTRTLRSSDVFLAVGYGLPNSLRTHSWASRTILAYCSIHNHGWAPPWPSVLRRNFYYFHLVCTYQ